jgi:hypothetical protein
MPLSEVHASHMRHVPVFWISRLCSVFKVATVDADRTKDGNFTHGYGYPRVSYPHGQGMGILLYPRVVPIPYPLSHIFELVHI